MDSLYTKYGKQVQFYLVYIREAHPTDGWRSGANDRQGILIKQPKSLKQRVAVCNLMCTKLKLPALVDSLDDKTNQAYNALPDRLYLVSAKGRIAFQGQRGPGAFDRKSWRMRLSGRLNGRNPFSRRRHGDEEMTNE